MICPYHKGWQECQAAKKKERKILEQIIHLAKGLITTNKADSEKIKNIFGPMVFSIMFITILYSLTGIASVFYEK